MTDMTDSVNSGETRMKIRRNRFYRFVALGMGASAILGIALGYTSDMFTDGRLPAWLLFALLALALVGCTWFCWSYFHRVDELDVMDNLWAALISIYFYMAAAPIWWLLHDVGVAPEVNHFAVYLATLGVNIATYSLRKLGLR